MKRKLTVLVILLLVLLCSGFVMADGLEKQSAEQCWKACSPAVFYVRGYDGYGTLKSTGSGFTVTRDGLAVTAAHVVNAMTRVTVILDGAELETEVVRCDADSDIAVLKLPAGIYAFLKTADNAPSAGAVVRAIGYPMKDTKIITEGVVNAAEATISGKSRMLVSCDIVNGMSGGPIIDEYGQAVGLCSGSVRTMSGIHLSALTVELRQIITEFLEVTK